MNLIEINTINLEQQSPVIERTENYFKMTSFVENNNLLDCSSSYFDSEEKSTDSLCFYSISTNNARQTNQSNIPLLASISFSSTEEDETKPSNLGIAVANARIKVADSKRSKSTKDLELISSKWDDRSRSKKEKNLGSCKGKRRNNNRTNLKSLPSSCSMPMLQTIEEDFSSFLLSPSQSRKTRTNNGLWNDKTSKRRDEKKRILKRHTKSRSFPKLNKQNTTAKSILSKSHSLPALHTIEEGNFTETSASRWDSSGKTNNKLSSLINSCHSSKPPKKPKRGFPDDQNYVSSSDDATSSSAIWF